MTFKYIRAIFYHVTAGGRGETKKNVCTWRGTFFFSANFQSIFLKLGMNMKVLEKNFMEIFRFSDPEYDLVMDFENFKGACRILFLMWKRGKIYRN